MTTPEKPKPAVCDFCKGIGIVGNALSWTTGKPYPALPCPRCGGKGTM